MTQRSSGWYDDPHDDSQLRYFDGIMWSDRTMPKLRPELEHVGEARPASERVSQSEPQPRPGEPRTYPAHWGPETPDQTQRNAGPFAPPAHQQPRRQGVGPGAIGGLGARFVANIIDRIVIGVVVSAALMIVAPDTISLMQDWLRDVVENAQAGSSAAPNMPGPLQTAMVWMSLATAGLGIIYDTVMTSLCKGKTLGRMALGLAVVPAESSQNTSARVPLSKSLVRSLIKWGPEAFGGFGEILQLVIFLTALGNPQRQGVHDRLARTVVRRTRGTQSTR